MPERCNGKRESTAPIALGAQFNTAIDRSSRTAIVRRMTRAHRATPVPLSEVDEGSEIDTPAELDRELGDLSALAAADDGWRWQVHRKKSALEMQSNPRGKPRIWVTTIHGAVDLKEFQDIHGGGAYEFWGSRDGQLRTRIEIELDGVPKQPTQQPVAVASSPGANGSAVSTAPPTDTDRRLDRLERLIERALDRPPAAAAQPTSLKEIIEGLVAMDTLRGRGDRQPANPDKEIVGTMVEILQQGIQLGQAREPASPEGPDTAGTVLQIVEKLGPILGRILDRTAARRTGPARPPSPPPAAEAAASPPPTPTGSYAEVVQETMETRRMVVAADRLADSFTNGDEIDDAAETVERIIPAKDLDAVLAMPAEAVIDELAQHPALASPEGREYIARVLIELKRPEDEVSIP